MQQPTKECASEASTLFETIDPIKIYYTGLVAVRSYALYIIISNEECASKVSTLLGELLHVGCCNLEIATIAHACQVVYAFSWKRVVHILILHPASHQSARANSR